MTTRFYPDPGGPLPGPGGALGVVAPKDTSRLRVLVRGSGSIGARHLRVLSAMGVGEIFAWPVRPDPRFTERPDIPDEAIVVDSLPATGLDLIIIATDTARHVDDALEALAGAPLAVLLEKPAAARAADAAPLLSHPEAARISVSAPLRFHEGLLRLADLLPDLGNITSASVRSQSWLPSWRPGRDYRDSYSARAAEGGVLRDLVHDIDYPVWLFGPPARLSAQLGYGTLGIEAEESADLSWTAGSPAHPVEVSVRLDYITRSKSRDIRVRGSAGTAGWDVVSNTVSHTASGLTQEYSFPDDSSVDTVLARQTSAVLDRSGALGPRPAAHFTPASLLEGVGAVAVCDAAKGASASGTAETVVL